VSLFGVDSNIVFARHRPPKMSVAVAIGPIPEDLVSKLEPSSRRARLRSSVKMPCASGVHPLRTSCENAACPFALRGKLLRCFCEGFPLSFFLALDADRLGQHGSPLRNLVAVWGRFGQEPRSFGQWMHSYAFYANGSMPHKHWLFRILLIWRVGT